MSFSFFYFNSINILLLLLNLLSIFKLSYTATTVTVKCVVDDRLKIYYSSNGVNYVLKADAGNNIWNTLTTTTISVSNSYSILKFEAKNEGGGAMLMCSIDYNGHIRYTNTLDKHWSILSGAVDGTTIYKATSGNWPNNFFSGTNAQFIWNKATNPTTHTTG